MHISHTRLVIYLVAILFALLAALPNILPDTQRARLPGFLPGERVALGLDLRGGSHLVLEVDSAGLVRERLAQLAGDVRDGLRKTDIAIATIHQQNNTVSVILADAGDRSRAQAALKALAMPTAMGGKSDLEIGAPAADRLSITLSESGMRDRINAAAEQSVEIVRRRIDQIGVAEPTIQRVGSDRVLVQLPGIQDPGRIRALLGSTAKLSFHMVADNEGYGTRTLPGAQDSQLTIIRNAIALSGDRLSDARASVNSRTNEPVIAFRLDNIGARRFGEITRDNVGRPFAIVLDGKVLSAPVIREPILGGAGEISGGFSMQEASDLAALLRAGALPAPLTVVEERTVGPDLGGDAIARGLHTGLAGFALVVGFMLLLYGRWGWLANLALFLNVVMTFGALSLLGATLTLPGIAGIVLGIGLAVDANVLINERIREETRKGARAIVALDLGFRRAYATIIDSNLTALIATTLLFMFGSGPVKGFAVTMGLGIAISMFTAVSVVRVLMATIVNWCDLAVLDIRPLFGRQLIPDNTAIAFMRGRFLGLAVSLFLSVASIALFFSPGLNYGIDFKGGLQMELVSSQPMALAPLRLKLDRLELGDISLQQFDGGSRVLLRAERQPGGEAAQTAALQKIRAAVLSVDQGTRLERTEMVGPKISGELAHAAFLSVFLASLAMLAYIWVRFEWPFAIGAIATLVLDVTKTVGFFAITGLEFNLTAIAALLTLIGYSVNDKVVVYDRMRENMRRYKKMPLRELIDLSINETLGRSLYTSCTAFLALVPMAIWGGRAVESFAIPMVFGVVIAASSSIFIAAPILLFLGDWRQRRKKGMHDRSALRVQSQPDASQS